MGESSKAHLKELLESFDDAMLITRHGEEMHARPMAVADVEGANTLWFVTSTGAPKSDEIRLDSRVSVTFQSSTRFVALSGRGVLVHDKAKIDQLWKPSWKAWFPNGKDDPSIALIQVTVTDAELWDNAGLKGIRYAFEVAKAALTGTTPDVDAAQHARVKPTNGDAPVSSRH
ncbi:MAG: pyridoxamine 5'-phosphate oxidase family protein [Labilithrix sp.]|nr:pyridoxamine 5'-phosphate oxidase family protein [Labilithrix sp.]MCW5813217.1 pyridoxamine 5'-phosphate oxidase family protein [Labilithrix sp.]